MARTMLTTIDNPYNPFTQWDEWLAYDLEMGYNSCGLLARIAKNSFELSEADQELENERAIDEIIALDPLLIYRKIKR